MSVAFFFGLVLGAAGAVASAAAFVRSERGTAWMQQLLLTSSMNDLSADLPSGSSPLVEPSSSDPSIAPSTSSSASSTISILVPKAYANEEYFNSVNLMVADYNTWVALFTQKVSPAMTAISTQASSGKLTGIFDRVVEAKTLIAELRSRGDIFAEDLNHLAAANLSTSDVQTKQLTESLIAQGIKVHGSMNMYTDKLESLFGGGVPSKQQMADAITAGEQLSNGSALFTQKIQELSSYFAKAIR